MPTITFYRANRACPSPHTPDGVESADGSITRAAYLSIHPSGFVPALDVDGEIITELPAVLNYIVSLAPPSAAAGTLLGADDLGRARVAEWLAWLSGSLHGQGFGMLWRAGRFTDDEGAHEGVRTKGREFIDGCFRRIEERLRGREFAVGEGLTVVDFNLYVFWTWGIEIGVQMAELYPSYADLMRRVESIEAVRTVVKTEGLKLTATA
ncbi:glutathione S-transferase [Phialemonium atrogriseum]|uniref:Glutathione S-transferase n=1 Tax=Phialemonium atrogriseum TaxID=1093897 RepID=A0AAJ0BZN3_9PEZI|nr:glutathione S-transferase [Phialemonium atrogriseum]KAK1766012.1 glutathione S-transferase [Phialemonium atrogriseum]